MQLRFHALRLLPATKRSGLGSASA
ncbi:MAG: hypothetical protein QOJ27_149, partial [Sphingomonadales bacterium]|nr:hypothetical protein [Sphingomonadales bacterium]